LYQLPSEGIKLDNFPSSSTLEIIIRKSFNN
jgi:hypothetical protein